MLILFQLLQEQHQLVLDCSRGTAGSGVKILAVACMVEPWGLAFVFHRFGNRFSNSFAFSRLFYCKYAQTCFLRHICRCSPGYDLTKHNALSRVLINFSRDVRRLAVRPVLRFRAIVFSRRIFRLQILFTPGDHTWLSAFLSARCRLREQIRSDIDST